MKNRTNLLNLTLTVCASDSLTYLLLLHSCHRVEIILSGYGFTGGNSIACTNLCRDEVTSVLKDKIESAFGSSFNTNGLGGVLTCGVTGMGAGLSHSPKCDVSID